MLARTVTAAAVAATLLGCALVPVKPDPGRRVETEPFLGRTAFRQGGRNVFPSDLRSMLATDADQADRVRQGSRLFATGTAAASASALAAFGALGIFGDKSARWIAGGTAAGLLAGSIWAGRAADRRYAQAVEAHNARVAAGKPAPGATSRVLTTRETRPTAVLFDAGWNGLAGWGVTFVSWPHTRVAADVVMNVAGSSMKCGGRLRANLVHGPVTPTFGVGYSVVDTPPGPDGTRYETLRAEAAGELPIRYALGLSQYAQALGGVEWAGRSGFTVLAAAGWSWRIHDALAIVEGVPSARQRDRLDRMYGSGPTVSLAIGRSF